jgi:hypothetical protein
LSSYFQLPPFRERAERLFLHFLASGLVPGMPGIACETLSATGLHLAAVLGNRSGVRIDHTETVYLFSSPSPRPTAVQAAVYINHVIRSDDKLKRPNFASPFTVELGIIPSGTVEQTDQDGHFR